MYVVRRAEAKDAGFISQIFYEAVLKAQWIKSEANRSSSFVSESVGETVVVCCGRDGEILGFVSIYEPESFIHHLFVAEKHRSQGVGSMLLKSLQAWLPMPWYLKCVESNQNALAFYLSKGWVNEDRGTGPDGSYVLLKKELA